MNSAVSVKTLVETKIWLNHGILQLQDEARNTGL